MEDAKQPQAASALSLPTQAYALGGTPCSHIHAQTSSKYQFVTEIQQWQPEPLARRHIGLLEQVFERPRGSLGIELETFSTSAGTQPQRPLQQLRSVQARAGR